MEVEVEIKQVFPAQEVTFMSGKSIMKGGFLAETGGQYSKGILFQVVGKKCDILQYAQVGSRVNVAFDIESREFKGKYYTDVTAFAINQVGQQNYAPRQSYVGQVQPTQYAPVSNQPLPQVSEPQQSQGNPDEALPF